MQGTGRGGRIIIFWGGITHRDIEHPLQVVVEQHDFTSTTPHSDVGLVSTANTSNSTHDDTHAYSTISEGIEQ